MFDKIAKIVAKLNGTVWMAVAIGIVAVVFVIGLVMSLGGELSKFKKVAARVIKDPSSANAQAKHLPIRARKQYKAYRQAGGKPDDSITPDACVYTPFKESAAARFPAAVMTAGILSILLSFFVAGFAKNAGVNDALAPAVVTVAVMVLRLLAGLISSAIVKSGAATYYKYVAALGKNAGGEHEEPQPAPAQTYAAQEESQPAAYGNTFDQPSHITVELEEEPTPVFVQEEQEPEPQTVVMPEPQESEEEIRARARAQAMERARAEQAAAQAAAQAQAAQAAQAQPQSQPQPAPAAQPQPAAGGSSSADEVIARIEKIKQEGGTLAQMKEVALSLQKERAKPENKTPEMQRKLNEALAALLKSMSGANRK